jgi:uncharacterized surface protein with fasciclin (FAS1) repeats
MRISYRQGTAISASVGLAIALALPATGTSQQGSAQAISGIAALDRIVQPPSQLAQADGDIVDTAIAAGDFTTLISLLDELGMAEDLRGFGRFTVFAPTDAAFAGVPDEIMQVLMSDRELLADVLAYHVVAAGEPYLSENVTEPLELRTLERSTIDLNRRGRNLYVNDVRVIDADIEASNGVIHAIDEVLIPEGGMPEILPQL